MKKQITTYPISEEFLSSAFVFSDCIEQEKTLYGGVAI